MLTNTYAKLARKCLIDLTAKIRNNKCVNNDQFEMMNIIVKCFANLSNLDMITDLFEINDIIRYRIECRFENNEYLIAVYVYDIIDTCKKIKFNVENNILIWSLD